MRSVAIRPGRIVLSVMPSPRELARERLERAEETGAVRVRQHQRRGSARARPTRTRSRCGRSCARASRAPPARSSRSARPPARGGRPPTARGVNSSGSPPGGPPVLVTRMSIGPRSRSTFSSSSGAASRSSVSCTYGRRADLGGGRLDLLARPGAHRHPRALARPALARSPKPMPCEAPVTSATLPSRPRSMTRRVSASGCRVAPMPGLRLLLRMAPFLVGALADGRLAPAPDARSRSPGAARRSQVRSSRSTS